MGIALSSCYTKHIVQPRELRAKICILEEQIKEIRREKEQNEHLFSLQRRKHKEDLALLRRKAEEQEEIVSRLQAEAAAEAAAVSLPLPPPATAVFGGKEWEWRPRLERDFMVEIMREEQARKEAAVEKWKQLYLAIKTELDDLILRTNEGGHFFWGSEQEAMVERLKRELKVKEEALEALRAKVMAMEREEERREREIDIVRQSHRILTNTRRNRGRGNMKKCLHM